jgi:hypothetical protein
VNGPLSFPWPQHQKVSADVTFLFSPFDYSAKSRGTENAPICDAESPNDALLPRAVTDEDYSCGPNKPCSNGMGASDTKFSLLLIILRQAPAALRRLGIVTMGPRRVALTANHQMMSVGAIATLMQNVASLRPLQEPNAH